MSRTGRAVVTHGRDFEIFSTPFPTRPRAQCCLRQELTGICGTDLHNWQKGLPVDTLQGHEVVGIVEAPAAASPSITWATACARASSAQLHPRNSGVAYGLRRTNPSPAASPSMSI